LTKSLVLDIELAQQENAMRKDLDKKKRALAAKKGTLIADYFQVFEEDCILI
tara:strand:+ start:56 stop:211 length:156 start_codon:yes stop_codon:yes gene_type:complete